MSATGALALSEVVYLKQPGVPPAAAATIAAHFGTADASNAHEPELEVGPDEPESEDLAGLRVLAAAASPAAGDSRAVFEAASRVLEYSKRERAVISLEPAGAARAELRAALELAAVPEPPSGPMAGFDEAAVLAWLGSVPGLTAEQRAAGDERMAAEGDFDGDNRRGR